MEAGAGGGTDDPTGSGREARDWELSATTVDLFCGRARESVAKASATTVLDDGKDEAMGLTSADRVDTWLDVAPETISER
jgi:hypothetical protein